MTRSDTALVILTPGFPANEADANCLPLQQELVSAMSRGLSATRIVVLTFQYPYHTTPYRWKGVDVIPFDGRNKRGLYRLLRYRKIHAYLEGLASTNRIVGMLSFWFGECAEIGHTFGTRHGIPHYCWLLGQDARRSNRYPRKLRLPPDALVAVSDSIRSNFNSSHGISPTYTIPAAINPCLFGMKQRKDIDLLAVGSLISLKRFEIFVELAALLKATMPEIGAVLVGDGPEYAQLKKRIDRLGLSANLEMTGELPYTKTIDYMQRARLLIHPSSYEGFSGVCLEALAASCHVVSFRTPMDRAIAQWHAVNSMDELYGRSVSLLSNRRLRYEQVMPYHIEDTAARFLRLFSGAGISAHCAPAPEKLIE